MAKAKTKPTDSKPPDKPAQPGVEARLIMQPDDVKPMARLGVEVFLSAPFPAGVMKWKPQSVKNSRCLAVAYLDARMVMDRLDEVVGVGGWADDYEIREDGSVLCRLSLRIAGEWVTKCDVGSPSDQPDSGDRMKAALSDALKRAAVKFGVGRYIYKLPKSWVDFDPVSKTIKNPPRLPDWALPKVQPEHVVAYADDEEPEAPSLPAPKPAASVTKPEPEKPPVNASRHAKPKDKWTLEEWIAEWQAIISYANQPDHINDALPNLKLIADEDVKNQVWAFVVGTVKPTFPYNSTTKRFQYK